MGLYEIQVLDSYQSKTYADGQASAVYGQFPPQVNASRAPGQWQTYDIIFHVPRFEKDGKVLRPGAGHRAAHGVLVQDNVELSDLPRITSGLPTSRRRTNCHLVCRITVTRALPEYLDS